MPKIFVIPNKLYFLRFSSTSRNEKHINPDNIFPNSKKKKIEDEIPLTIFMYVCQGNIYHYHKHFTKHAKNNYIQTF